MNDLSAAWKTHEAELRHWVCHRLHDAAQADDVVQDIFLKALRQGERFDALHNPRAWLFEVARNILIDRFRLAHETVALPDDLPALTPETATVDKLTACLPRVLAELSAQDRDAITQCDLQGVAQADFARANSLSLSAAKSRLQRARQRLKARMTQACQVQLDSAGHVADFVPRP